MDPNKLQQGPIQHSELTDDQIARIIHLQQTFSEVDRSPLEKWIDDFKRDMHPDNEIKIWESIATAYEAFIKDKTLSSDAKREAYQILLARSGAPEEEVLKHLKLKALTEKDAQELMALFQREPEPIKVIKQ